MKSTDTILGAFGVMGILLLGVVVASSINTTDIEVDPTVVNTESEVVLESNLPEFDTVEQMAVVESSETLLGESNNNFDIARWQDYGITNQELLALVDSNDNNLALNDVDQSVLIELEQLLNNNLKETTLEFKQQNSDEVVLSEPVDQAEVEIESEVSDKDQQIHSNVDEDLNIIDDEIDQSESNKVTDKSGRVTSLFERLFGEEDNTNVGGSLEGEINSDLNNDQSYVVESGDNIWNILTIDYGMSNVEAAGAIGQMQQSPGSFGIDSGSVDLIYPGQVLNFGGVVGS